MKKKMILLTSFALACSPLLVVFLCSKHEDNNNNGNSKEKINIITKYVLTSLSLLIIVFSLVWIIMTILKISDAYSLEQTGSEIKFSSWCLLTKNTFKAYVSGITHNQYSTGPFVVFIFNFIFIISWSVYGLTYNLFQKK